MGRNETTTDTKSPTYEDLLALDGVMFVAGELDFVNGDALPEAERRGLVRFRGGRWQVTRRGSNYHDSMCSHPDAQARYTGAR